MEEKGEGRKKPPNKDQEYDLNSLVSNNAETLPDSTLKFLDLETKQSVCSVCDKISTYIHKFANEPSLALYRIRQHVTMKLCGIVEGIEKVKHANSRVERSLHEIKYADVAALNMYNCITSMKHIKNMLNTVLFNKSPEHIHTIHEDDLETITESNEMNQEIMDIVKRQEKIESRFNNIHLNIEEEEEEEENHVGERKEEINKERQKLNESDDFSEALYKKRKFVKEIITEDERKKQEENERIIEENKISLLDFQIQQDTVGVDQDIIVIKKKKVRGKKKGNGKKKKRRKKKIELYNEIQKKKDEQLKKEKEIRDEEEIRLEGESQNRENLEKSNPSLQSNESEKKESFVPIEERKIEEIREKKTDVKEIMVENREREHVEHEISKDDLGEIFEESGGNEKEIHDTSGLIDEDDFFGGSLNEDSDGSDEGKRKETTEFSFDMDDSSFVDDEIPLEYKRKKKKKKKKKKYIEFDFKPFD